MRARLAATVLVALLLMPSAVAAAADIGPGLATGPGNWPQPTESRRPRAQ